MEAGAILLCPIFFHSFSPVLVLTDDCDGLDLDQFNWVIQLCGGVFVTPGPLKQTGHSKRLCVFRIMSKSLGRSPTVSAGSCSDGIPQTADTKLNYN